MKALVLAGGRRDAVCDGTNAPNKAFVPIGGVPMVERVLRTLRSVPQIERITVVAPSVTLGDPALAAADERREAGDPIVESIERGLTGFDPGELVLLATSDAPLMAPISVEAFAIALWLTQADLVYSIAEKAAHDVIYPGVPHTWARMTGGVYCGGALFGMRPRVLPALRGFLDKLAAARKSPLRLASFFGWDVLVRFALALLSIEAAENRASAILGHEVRAQIVPPDCAFNVDRKSDIALAERFLDAESQRT
ncbi:MAG: nucleotidyltransferase family protein [Candidatus Eremiobacteraeota bacterium]|nr:nucleotidyltransferase family protein [Candidatus Eremiobacteraeota bacterium]